jgi:hypothetical protein
MNGKIEDVLWDTRIKGKQAPAELCMNLHSRIYHNQILAAQMA